MKDWVGGVFALGGVIVGAFLTNWLTYRRSTNEKLWDLRRESYGVILAELAGIDRICRAAEEYMTVHSANAYFDAEDSDSYFGDDLEKIGKHMEVVRERFANDYLIFSDEFRRILETFLAELDNFDPNVAGRNEHLRERSVMTRYRLPLLGQAQTEMKSEQGWWPFRQTVNRLIAWIWTTVNWIIAKILPKAIWKGPTRPDR